MKKKSKKIFIISLTSVLIPATIVGATFLALQKNSNYESSTELENILNPDHVDEKTTVHDKIELLEFSKYNSNDEIGTAVLNKFKSEYKEKIESNGLNFTFDSSKKIKIDSTGKGVVVLKENLRFVASIEVNFYVENLDDYFNPNISNIGKMEISSNDSMKAEILKKSLNNVSEEITNFLVSNLNFNYKSDDSYTGLVGEKFVSNFQFKNEFYSTANKEIKFYSLDEKFVPKLQEKVIYNDSGKSASSLLVNQNGDKITSFKNTIMAMYQVNEKCIIAANSDKLVYSLEINDDGSFSLKDSIKLTEQWVNIVYQTRTGSILVGVDRGKIFNLELDEDNKFLPNPKEIFTSVSGSTTLDDIQSIIQLDDENGTIIVSGEEGKGNGVEYIMYEKVENGEKIFYGAKQSSITPSRINGAIETKQGNLLVGTSGGHIYDRKYDLNSSEVFEKDLIETGYSATGVKGVNTYINHIFKLTIFEEDLQNDNYYVIHGQTANQTQYFNQITLDDNKEKVVAARNLNSEINIRIQSTVELSNGKLLASTYNLQKIYEISSIGELAK